MMIGRPFRLLLAVATLPALTLASQLIANTSASTESDSDQILQLLNTLQAAHPLWLRERCRESFYADPDTRQPKYNLHEEKEELVVLSVTLTNTANNQATEPDFIVKFSDQQQCFFSCKTAQAELNNEETFLQSLEWGFPELYLWNRTLHAPPMFEHDHIVNTTAQRATESDETRKFLSTLISTGIAVVSNVPRKEGECARFGAKFSSLRTTEWGTNFNVRSAPDAGAGVAEATPQRKDLAYTSHAIGMHVDSPYRVDTPPAYQLLHAIDHCHGKDCYVHNQFVDGYAVAQALCEYHPDYFDILAKTMLRWENNGGDDSSLLYRYAPMLEVVESSLLNDSEQDCKSKTIGGINFSAKSGGYAPHMEDSDQLDLFYNAKRKFSALLHSPDFTIQLQLYPGALVIFDNRRILHSRSEIAPTDGERWLQGCYLNRDGIHYHYEQLRRKFHGTTKDGLTETPFRTLREATKSDFDRMGVEYDAGVRQKTLSNLIELLEQQKSSEAYLGAPVSLYEHNLQTATRAYRAGEDAEIVTMSLFHDVFETLAVKNHGELAAAMLTPWISPQSQWLLAHHEIFQGYYYFEYYDGDKNLRDMFLDHPFYNATVEWCEKYDQASFDPDYPSLPLSFLVNVVEGVLARPEYWWNPKHPKAGAVSGGDTASVVSDELQYLERVHGGGGDPLERSGCKDTWTCYTPS